MSFATDIELLGKLFEARYALVLKAACRYAPDTNLAYDVVQQTFLVFVQGVREKGWDITRNIDPLLYEIAKITAKMIWAKEKKHSSAALRSIAELYLETSEDDVPDDTVARFEALKRCKDKLPEQHRKLLQRHYEQNITLEEIARENEKPSAAVRQLFCRIRAKLRLCIEQALKQVH